MSGLNVRQFFFSLFFIVAGLNGQGKETAFEYLASWGGPGKGPGEFRAPEGLDVSPSGFLYIADTGNQRIQMLDASGEFVTEIGGFGWGDAQLDAPVSVWAANGLDVFVADRQNHRIQRFDKDLHFINAFRAGEDWPDYLTFRYPLDVTLSDQGELFCLDGENRRVLKLDIAGDPQISFGDFDAGEGRLNDPKRIALGGGNLILVSNADEIAAFDLIGNFLYSFGRNILKAPADLCVANNRIFVADPSLKEVVVFRSPGMLESRFAVPPISGQVFKEPVAVAVWKDRVYVLDRERCVIDVFLWKAQ